MALLGFWGMGNGRVPEVCVVSDTPITYDDQANGLPAYAPWGMYPPTNDTIYFDLPDKANATDSIFVGWWGRYSQSITTATPWYVQQSGVSEYLRFQCNGTTDTISVRIGTSYSGTTLTFDTITGLVLDDWNFYEVEWYPHSTSGVLRVRVNGATPTGWTDVDGGDTSVQDSSNLGFNLWQRNAAVWYGRTAGVYALDSSGASNNDFLGVCRFPYLEVDGSSESDWTGSDGNQVDNHLLIDGPPAARASITDYVESSTTTDRQVCTVESFTALGLSGGTIIAAQSTAYAQDSGAGGQLCDVGLRSNAIDQVTEKTLATTTENHSHLSLVDPNTGSAWTTAGLDAAETLVEVA